MKQVDITSAIKKKRETSHIAKSKTDLNYFHGFLAIWEWECTWPESRFPFLFFGVYQSRATCQMQELMLAPDVLVTCLIHVLCIVSPCWRTMNNRAIVVDPPTELRKSMISIISRSSDPLDPEPDRPRSVSQPFPRLPSPIPSASHLRLSLL